MSYLKQRSKSFRYAFEGIIQMLRSEPNSRIHLIATILVAIAGIAFEITRFEWIAILLTVSGVWICELFNSALETLCDKVEPDLDPLIKRVKDYGAAATLVAAIISVVIAAFIFLPKL